MEYRQLRCVMTDAEMSLKASELAKQLGIKADIEAAKKAAAESAKSQLSLVDGQIGILAYDVRTKAESRPVQIEDRRNDADMMIETYRLDTGERIDARPMTIDERQPKLFDVGGGKAKRSASAE